MLTTSVAGKYTVTVKIANAYTAANPSVTTELNGSPFTVTCTEPGKEPVPDEPGKEPVPDEPKKWNDTATVWATLLKNWFLDNWFSVVLFIALVYLYYLHFTKKPDPPQVVDKPKDDSSKDSLMIVILE